MEDRSTAIISALIYDLHNFPIHVIDTSSFSIYILCWSVITDDLLAVK